MGQKVHPGGLRVGVIHDWKSNWYTGKKEFADYLLEDIKIREHITSKLSHAGLSDILIRKDKQRITVDIYTARPGIVIGKSGVEVDALRKELHAITQKNVHININEIKRPELDAKLVAQSIAEQLQNRVSFRRAMKRALASAHALGRAGRQDPVRRPPRRRRDEPLARRYSEGRVPLHTIRADIDYGFAEAKTTFGRIGVKVWINKGEIMPEGYEGVDRARTRASATRIRPAAAAAARPRASAPPARAARGRGQDREGLGLVAKAQAAAPRRAGAGRAAAAAVADRGRPDAPRAEQTVRGARADASRSSAERRPSDARRRPSRRRRARADAAAEEDQVPQAAARPPRAASPRGRPTVQFGEYGLKALEHGWITNRQIEAARIAMTRKIKRGGKVWINVFPDKPVTQEAGRDPHGLGQGLPRGLGRGRQAGPRDVRAGRRARAARARGAAPRRPEAADQDEVREAGG